MSSCRSGPSCLQITVLGMVYSGFAVASRFVILQHAYWGRSVLSRLADLLHLFEWDRRGCFRTLSPFVPSSFLSLLAITPLCTVCSAFSVDGANYPS